VAYLTFVAAVPEVQIAAIRSDATYVLSPTLIKGVSHVVSYWIQVQPLGQILQTVIDGGDCLNNDFWHPLRAPMLHLSITVPQLTESLKKAWTDVNDNGTEQDEWLASEMDRLLTVMNHGVETGACIVTALDLPGDYDRARRVRIPWMAPQADHGVPRRRRWKLW